MCVLSRGFAQVCHDRNAATCAYSLCITTRPSLATRWLGLRKRVIRTRHYIIRPYGAYLTPTQYPPGSPLTLSPKKQISASLPPTSHLSPTCIKCKLLQRREIQAYSQACGLVAVVNSISNESYLHFRGKRGIHRSEPVPCAFKLLFLPRNN